MEYDYSTPDFSSPIVELESLLKELHDCLNDKDIELCLIYDYLDI